jgi:hypothetical protein
MPSTASTALLLPSSAAVLMIASINLARNAAVAPVEHARAIVNIAWWRFWEGEKGRRRRRRRR